MYYQKEPRLNGVCSRDNLPNKTKDWAFVINLDEYLDIGTHWIALYVNNKTVAYFDSFGVEHIPKEIKKFVINTKIIANIFRLQAYDSIMCGYFCIGFVDFIFNGISFKRLLNFFYLIFKMVEISSVASIEHNSIDTLNLKNQQFRLNKINEIENYFIAEIKKRELMSERLSKYVASFDYFDKSLIFLSTIIASISVASFATVIGIPRGIASASLSLTFLLCTEFVIKSLKATKSKKKNIIKLLC